MKFSILTPSYNQDDFIEKNINSVMNQNWDDVEHIIIDGGSTDNTLNILKKYPHLKWVSEPDEGQADALNKGLKMATGDIIGWINSDDYYEPNIFHGIVAIFENEVVQWVIGNTSYIYPSFGIIVKSISPKITYEKLIKNPDIIAQPSAFFRKDILIAAGGWNKKYYMTMDLDLWIRLSKIESPKMVDIDWAIFTNHEHQKSSPRNILIQLSNIIDIFKRENASQLSIIKIILKKCYYWLKAFLKNILIQLHFLDKKYINATISLIKKHKQ